MDFHEAYEAVKHLFPPEEEEEQMLCLEEEEEVLQEA